MSPPYLVAISKLNKAYLMSDEKNKSAQPEDAPAAKTTGLSVGVGVALGAGIGTALGAALGNIAVGIAIGVGIGVAVGAAFEMKAKGGME